MKMDKLIETYFQNNKIEVDDGSGSNVDLVRIKYDTKNTVSKYDSNNDGTNDMDIPDQAGRDVSFDLSKYASEPTWASKVYDDLKKEYFYGINSLLEKDIEEIITERYKNEFINLGINIDPSQKYDLSEIEQKIQEIKSSVDSVKAGQQMDRDIEKLTDLVGIGDAGKNDLSASGITSLEELKKAFKKDKLVVAKSVNNGWVKKFYKSQNNQKFLGFSYKMLKNKHPKLK